MPFAGSPAVVLLREDANHRSCGKELGPKGIVSYLREENCLTFVKFWSNLSGMQASIKR